jgi:hypothetical protein
MRLADCISGVESSHNVLAIRFEPVMFQNKPKWVLPLLDKISTLNGNCTNDTALAIACTSYGKYQILGVNIYDKRYPTSIAHYWQLESDQDLIFARFISAEGFSPEEDVTTWDNESFTEFATFYNGPGNVEAYVTSMKKQAGMTNG